MSWNGDVERPTSARQRGYTGAWDKARKAYLAAHPHCVICAKQHVITLATVVDHIIPHKGDRQLFWNSANWQSLCKLHHDSDKKLVEAGRRPKQMIGPDGWPTS